MNDYRFKIKGLDKLMTYNELMESGVHSRCIKIIDMKALTTWVTDYQTIVKKFG